MQDNHIGPKVTALSQACEQLLGFLQGNGKLSALEVEVLHYYSRELVNHLTSADPTWITITPPSLITPRKPTPPTPTARPFGDSSSAQ